MPVLCVCEVMCEVKDWALGPEAYGKSRGGEHLVHAGLLRKGRASSQNNPIDLKNNANAHDYIKNALDEIGIPKLPGSP